MEWKKSFFAWILILFFPDKLLAQSFLYKYSIASDSVIFNNSQTKNIYINNDSNTPITCFLYIESNAEAKVIETKNNNKLSLNSLILSDWETDGIHSFTKISLEAHQIREFNLEIVNHQPPLSIFFKGFKLHSPTKFSIYKGEKFEKKLNTLRNKYESEILSSFIILGALGFVSIFSFIIFIQYRTKLLGFYFLYGLSNFLLLLSKIILHHWIDGKNPHNFLYLTYLHFPESLQMFGIISYLFFLITLLDLEKNYQKFSKLIKIVALLILIYGIADPIVLILTNSVFYHEQLFIYAGIIILPCLIGILIWFSFKIRHQLIKYVVFCNCFLLLLLFVAYLRYGPFAYTIQTNLLDVIFTMPFAVLVEMLIFGFAIAYKIEDERRQKESIEKKVMEIEMMALRSQMNPHFIFNSLNSVRYFVLSDQKDKAKDYLSKFSKLLRTILNYSKENVISLHNELEAIRLYIEVELGRFESNLHYSIEIDKEIETEYIMIPPLFLQPYVENAIIHGLRNSEKEDKLLKISILQQKNECLEISIEDNGIGRNKAEKLKQNREALHQSLGTQITNQRMELFNQNFKSKIKVTIEDLPQESGTKVVIQIIQTKIEKSPK